MSTENTELALIKRDNQTLEVSLTDDWYTLESEALAKVAFVAKVETPSQNDAAVKAQLAVDGALRLLDKWRDRMNRPLLDARTALDNTVKTAKVTLQTQQLRIARLTGDYAALQKRKADAEAAQARLEQEKIEKSRRDEIQRQLDDQNAKQRELDEQAAKAKADGDAQLQAEIDRQREIANANSLAAIDRINDEASLRVADAAPKIEIVRAKGQVVKQVWKYEIADLLKFANNYPHLVKIEPRHREIVESLDVLGELKACRSWQEIESGTRAPRGKDAIEV